MAIAARSRACLPKFSGIYPDLDTAHRELCAFIGVDPAGPLGMFIRGARKLGLTCREVTGVDFVSISLVHVDDDQVVTVIEDDEEEVPDMRRGPSNAPVN
jgi:hypothetical protein